MYLRKVYSLVEWHSLILNLPEDHQWISGSTENSYPATKYIWVQNTLSKEGLFIIMYSMFIYTYVRTYVCMWNDMIHIQYVHTIVFQQGSLYPGLHLDVKISFLPKSWKYHCDSIRIHCSHDATLLVPVHAYPKANVSKFPQKLSFPPTPLGQR